MCVAFSRSFANGQTLHFTHLTLQESKFCDCKFRHCVCERDDRCDKRKGSDEVQCRFHCTLLSKSARDPGSVTDSTQLSSGSDSGVVGLGAMRRKENFAPEIL